jgi:hypothetical protein
MDLKQLSTEDGLSIQCNAFMAILVMLCWENVKKILASHAYIVQTTDFWPTESVVTPLHTTIFILDTPFRIRMASPGAQGL